MNYWERHIGDYARDTAHLSMIEHGAYTLLLDRYYATEKPIAADQAHRLARARSKEEKAAVDAVLGEFFSLINGEWHHNRVDREIEKANVRIDAARANGTKGGRPRKQKESQEKPTGFPLGSDSETQSKALHTPDSIHQTPNTSVPNGTGGEPPTDDGHGAKLTDPDEIIFGYGLPLLTNAGTPEKQARSFLGGLRKNHGDHAVIDALRDCLRSKPLQPLEWLAATLPPAGKRKQSKHSGFDQIDYHAGVNPDGTF